MQQAATLLVITKHALRAKLTASNIVDNCRKYRNYGSRDVSLIKV